MKKFNNGKPFHGSEDISNGKLIGTTDTDCFYFFCPKCGDAQILQILDFGVVKEGSVEYAKKHRSKAKKDFIIAFK